MRHLFAYLLIGLVGIQYAAVGYAKEGKTFHTREYKKHKKGFKHDAASKKHLQSMRHLSFLESPLNVPGKLDLSPLVSLPEDQGQCGSCWDFSLTKALRSEYMLAGKDPGKLEFNFLLNNCGPGPKMGGCNGGSFAAASSFLVSGKGPGLDALNPYVGRPGRCKRLPVKGNAVKAYMIGKGGTPTFKDLVVALAQRHVLSIDVAAGAGEWEAYGGGVYNGCQTGPVDHMVNLVGASCSSSVDEKGNCVFDATGRAKNHDELLLVMNQWGNNWGTIAENGNGGYMWTKMYAEDGSHCNAVASHALMFMIDAPAPSPTPGLKININEPLNPEDRK